MSIHLDILSSKFPSWKESSDWSCRTVGEDPDQSSPILHWVRSCLVWDEIQKRCTREEFKHWKKLSSFWTLFKTSVTSTKISQPIKLASKDKRSFYILKIISTDFCGRPPLRGIYKVTDRDTLIFITSIPPAPLILLGGRETDRSARSKGMSSIWNMKKGLGGGEPRNSMEQINQADCLSQTDIKSICAIHSLKNPFCFLSSAFSLLKNVQGWPSYSWIFIFIPFACFPPHPS